MRTVLGEPTGTSAKFASMMDEALQGYAKEHNLHFEKVTKMALEGDGTIDRRVDRYFKSVYLRLIG